MVLIIITYIPVIVLYLPNVYLKMRRKKCKLRGKKVVMPTSNEFEDTELLYPLLRLSEEGAWITIATFHASFSAEPYVNDKPITGRFGTPVPPVILAEGYRFDIKSVLEVNADDYDAVVIPGGFSPDILRREPKVTELSAICITRTKLLVLYVILPGW